MLQIVALSVLLVTCTAEDFYHFPHNVTRSTVSGIAAYRSALTLDWLAGEDSRQRELVNAFETEAPPKPRIRTAECIAYSRPSSGKVARLLLELLKNLEGDEGVIIPEMVQALVRTKLLVETSMLDSEPDLESLVHTPGVMMGEPHATFPRIIALIWMVATDPITTKRSGWCSVKKLNQYLMITRPAEIAKQMRALDPIIARARFIMEEFIQNVTPLNIYPESTPINTPKEKRTKNRYRLVRTGSDGMDSGGAMAEPSATASQQDFLDLLDSSLDKPVEKPRKLDTSGVIAGNEANEANGGPKLKLFLFVSLITFKVLLI